MRIRAKQATFKRDDTEEITETFIIIQKAPAHTLMKQMECIHINSSEESKASTWKTLV